MDAVRADGISALRAGNARLGSPSGGAGAQRLRGTYTNPAALPFRGGKPLRRRRADEFPRNGVRYIAMNDGIDTLRDNNDIDRKSVV